MSLPGGNIYELKAGKIIRNVIGSSNDPLFPNCSNWIKAWQSRTKKFKICCVCGYSEKTCNKQKVIGGHILLGSTGQVGNGTGAAANIHDNLVGENRVFIAPICTVCNQNPNDMQVTINTSILNLRAYFWDSYPHAGVNKLAFKFDGTEEQFKKKYASYIRNYSFLLDMRFSHQKELQEWDKTYLRTSTNGTAAKPATSRYDYSKFGYHYY